MHTHIPHLFTLTCSSYTTLHACSESTSNTQYQQIHTYNMVLIYTRGGQHITLTGHNSDTRRLVVAISLSGSWDSFSLTRKEAEWTLLNLEQKTDMEI